MLKPNFLTSLVCLFVLFSAAHAQPIIKYATPNGAGAKNGSSWADAYDNAAFCSALLSAPAKTAFYLSVGTYYPMLDPTGNAAPAPMRDKAFYLRDSIAIYGGFLGTETSLAQRPSILFDLPAGGTTLSGDIGTLGDTTDNAYHVVVAVNTSPAAVLNGCRIAGGRNNGGVGTLVLGGRPLYRYVGAGMCNEHSNATIESCIFTDNGAGSQGGAMYNAFSDVQVKNCVFERNYALLYGGGIYTNSGLGVYQNCVFVENTSDQGGAAYDYFAGTHFRNCTFVNNLAGTKGNAIRALSSYMIVSNCILWGNADTANVRAIMIQNGTPTIVSSIVQGCGGNLNWVATTGSNGGGNMDIAPQLGQMGDPDGADDVWMTTDDGVRPATGSPAIDMGSNFQTPPLDLIGIARPQGVTYDIGAYEAFTCNLDAAVAAKSISCFAGTTTAKISVSTGAGTYQYKVGNGSFQTADSFPALAAGKYHFTVKDAWGCIDTLSISLSQPAQLIGSLSATICAGSSYVFGSQVLTNAGTYTRVVSSASGCDSTLTLNLTVLPSPATPIISRTDDTLRVATSGSVQWWQNGVAIGTGNVWVLSENGIYSVCVTDSNGCMSCSADMNIQNVSVAQLVDKGISVFPNPFSEVLRISLGEQAPESDISLCLTNLLGQEIALMHCAGREAEFSTAHLPAGVYLLYITQQQQRIASLKVVKQ